MLRPNEVIINDSNYRNFLAPTVNGQKMRTGGVPRNYARHPVGYLPIAPPMDATDIPLIPESEWDARYDEKVATKSFLSDIRLAGNAGQSIPSLDQNGQGFCWAYSTAGAITMLRAIMGEPYVRLSAHAVACKIKNFQDEGGWGALSLAYATEHGYPDVQHWKEQSMSRSNDTPETWQNAALHKPTAAWVDLQAAEYDRTLSWQQVMTLLFCNVPVVSDFNWWGHSVCAIDPVRISKGNWGVRILNSWSDSWSDRGMGVLEGSKARPDGAVAPRVVTAAAA